MCTIQQCYPNQPLGFSKFSFQEKGAHIIVGTFPHSRAREVFCQVKIFTLLQYVWLLNPAKDFFETNKILSYIGRGYQKLLFPFRRILMT